MSKQNKQLAFVFPGQGSQSLGMLKEAYQRFPEVQATFEEASKALGMDIWRLIQVGPEETLNNTVNTQPALLAAGVALWRVWQAKTQTIPYLLAGHSLGEYTALVCANAMTLSDGIKLVAQRGQFMQEAVPQGAGAMAAVLGLDNAILAQICLSAAAGEIVAPVNFNAVGQTVIAGNKAAVERASILAKEKGAKRVLPLPVSVPSHCELMRGASLKLAQTLENTKILPPTIPLLHNVDVDTTSHPDEIRERLVKQLYLPVRWLETMQRFAQEGIEWVVECGPGKVLSGLTKRSDTNLKALNIESTNDLQETLNQIG